MSNIVFKEVDFSFSDKSNGSSSKDDNVDMGVNVNAVYAAIKSWKLSYSDTSSDHNMTAALVEINKTDLISGSLVDIGVKVNWKDKNGDDDYDAEVTVLVIGVTD